jgi:hypothetical protein
MSTPINIEDHSKKGCVSVPFSAKALAVVEAEARARGISASTLLLAALSDFLGRSAKVAGSKRLQPLVLHLDPALREQVVTVAKARGESVNRYVGVTLQRRAKWDAVKLAVVKAPEVSTQPEEKELVVT